LELRSHAGTPDVDELVDAVNEATRRHGLAWVRSLGRLLVDELFDGDLGQLRLGARRDVSLRAVARHPRLQISASSLWYALAIYDQLHQLPTALGEALTVSHHRRLVPLRDPTVKARLAERAVQQGWSVRRLGEEVRHMRRQNAPGRERRVGRPPLPGFVKAIRRLPRALEGSLEDLDPDIARRLGRPALRSLRAHLRLHVQQLKRLEQRLAELEEDAATDTS
jgi:hypothetical protein